MKRTLQFGGWFALFSLWIAGIVAFGQSNTPQVTAPGPNLRRPDPK